MAKLNNKTADIKPAPGYLLIEPEEKTKQTVSGIYLPETASADKPQTGIILGVGATIIDDGQKVESPVKVGDRVIYKKWGGNDVKIDNKEYLFVKFEDILAIIS